MTTIQKLKGKHPQYFEGILQMRNCSEEIINWVRKTVLKEKKAAITKDKKVRGGRDLYFSDQHYLQRIGKKLKETFPGTIKKSSKLFTVSRITGKEVHRVNMLFRGMPFRIGQKFNYLGEEVRITKAGKMITLLSKEGKRIVLPTEVFLNRIKSEKKSP
jgi:NMD protein affecting ribosome stability and mRNA decay